MPRYFQSINDEFSKALRIYRLEINRNLKTPKGEIVETLQNGLYFYFYIYYYWGFDLLISFFDKF